MLKKFLFTIVCALFITVAVDAQTTQNSDKTTRNIDTMIVLPFENSSGKAEFNWIGESFADSFSELLSLDTLKVTQLNVISNQNRKIIQQKLRIPLTALPSLATSLRLARESKATLLIIGSYNIIPATNEIAARIIVKAKIVRVNEGRFLNETFQDGSQKIRETVLEDALGTLQTIQGKMLHSILWQLDRNLALSETQVVEFANKVPARAFEGYIKGLLTSETDMQTRENFFKNSMRIYADDEKTKGRIYTEAALELGHLFLNQQKLPEAIDYFRLIGNDVANCLEKAKQEKKTPDCNEEAYAESSFYASLIYWRQQDYEQALGILRPLADDLKLTGVYNTLGAISIQASRAEKKNKGNADKLMLEGLEFLKKAAESSEIESNAKFNYGFALYLNNNFLESAKQIRPFLANNPRDGEAYFLLAKTLEKVGDTTSAEFDNQARRFLTDGNRYAKLATDWSAGKNDGIVLRVEQPARKDFVSVVLTKKQATPTQTQAPVNETDKLLAEAQDAYKKGNDDEAMTVIRKILAGEPMNAQSYLLLGKIHLRRTDLDQAIASLKTALFWDSNLIEAHVLLGRIYIQRNDCQSAQTYFASASAIDAEKQEVLGLKRMVERCSTK